MNCINVITNTSKNEISCLHYLKASNLFATGHEKGEIKLWNIELNNCLILD